MKSMTIAELIARLEAASAGSERLSWDIGKAIGEERPWRAYTTSLEAALTLVPDRMPVDLHIGPGPKPIANDATVFCPSVSLDYQGRRTTTYLPHEAKAARDGVIHWNTPALALCIAALKAREAQP